MNPLTAEIEISEVPCALYRFHGSDALLYVGITGNLKARLARHAADSPWWPEATRRTVVWYANRHDAEIAESTAVRIERPAHNTQHSVSDTNPHGLDEEVLRRCRVVRELRESHGFSRIELAAASGLGEALLGHIETGRRALTYRHLKKIADALDVPQIAITLPDYEQIRDRPRPKGKAAA